MSSKTIFLKLDGNTDEFRNHQIDAKQLANALSSFSDLVIESDRRLNGEDSMVSVKANAKFIEGSFGVEMIVEHIGHAKDVLTVLGFTAAGAATRYGLFNVIGKLKGRKIKEDITIDSNTGKAKLVLNDGTEEEVSPEIADLLESPTVRKRIDELVNGSLGVHGTNKLVIAEDENFNDRAVELTELETDYYKSNANSTRKPFELFHTTATIQFTKANRNSGTSGWKMTYLGQEVSVTINDEVFLNSIISDNSPSIFADKFSVQLTTKVRNSVQGSEKKYIITEVGPRVP